MRAAIPKGIVGGFEFTVLQRNHDLSNEAEYIYIYDLKIVTCRSYNQVNRNPKIYVFFNSLKIQGVSKFVPILFRLNFTNY